MKKLVVFAAVAVMAVVASATNVKWGIGGGGALTSFTAGTIYLVSGSLPTTDWASQTSFSESMIAGDVLASAALSDGAYYSTGTTITPASSGLSAGNKTVYAIAISSDGKDMAITSNTKTLNLQPSALSSTLAWGVSDFTSYTAVPEPTSALLLMLGVAGIALKRKRA